MRSLLARARAYETLTPGERALLRLVEGVASVALVGALTAGAQYLGAARGASLGAVDWAGVARVCAAGGVVALLMAVAKYCKAQGDPALGDAIAGLGARVASGPGMGGAVTPAAVPAVTTAAAAAMPEVVSAEAGAPPGVADVADVANVADVASVSSATDGSDASGAAIPGSVAAILPPDAPR
ncbi:MAG TPA: hypothetical protein VIC85_10850 [Ktedonobacterales bacterium]